MYALIYSVNKDLQFFYESFIEMPGLNASPEIRSYYFGTKRVRVSVRAFSFVVYFRFFSYYGRADNTTYTFCFYVWYKMYLPFSVGENSRMCHWSQPATSNIPGSMNVLVNNTYALYESSHFQFVI
jgi:hypothetical protein